MSFEFGAYFVVDLTAGEVEKKFIDEKDLHRFFAGSGIGAKLFVDEGDDAIVVANGLLTGLPVSTACKTTIIFHSPLTGIFGETSFGGFWGAQLKKTGLDALVIKGKSKTPVYLHASDGALEIRDAGELWGMGTFEAHQKLADELPPGSRIGVIGPAGENGAAFASMMFDGEFARAAGRTGVGCAFGHKNVKALTTKGTQKPGVHDAAGLKEFVRAINKKAQEKAAGLHNFGTAGTVGRREKSGDLPIKNFSQGLWQAAEKITGQAYVESMFHKHHGCFMCPIACAKSVKLKGGEHDGLITTQPEYETVGALGSNLLNDDPKGLAIANRLCNEYGLDTISTGVVIGFLFECVDRGIVKKADIGDIEETWGNVDAICRVIGMISRREGIGDILSKGVRKAAQSLGHGSEGFAVHSKGLELPMHDPRALVSSGATYASGSRGASHNEAPAYYLEEGMKIAGMGFGENPDPHSSEGKGVMTARMQNLTALFDALGICKFMLAGGVSIDELRRFLELAAGWSMTSESMLTVGDRIFTLKRLYNQRLGIAGKDDKLPPRIAGEVRGEGGAAQVLPDTAKMLADLYEYRGWDKQGLVKVEKARELGLESYMSNRSS
jgi:aldehyde:ferredoxin oxidoreductase